MKPVLSVLIVNYNCADFIALSLLALQSLTKNSYQVFIIDNNSKINDYHQLKHYCSKYPNIQLSRDETTLTGSAAHGFGLNKLTQKVDTPYFAILDADATFLYKNWDEVLIQELTDTVKAIGTEASGDKPKDFPGVYATLFETETFKKLKADFRPTDGTTHGDTGWAIRENYLAHHYQGKILELRNTRHYKTGPFKDILSAEFYYDKIPDHIFAAHFARGATLGAAKYTLGPMRYLFKIPFLGKQLLHHKGLTDKRRWITICKNIIHAQAIG